MPVQFGKVNPLSPSKHLTSALGFFTSFPAVAESVWGLFWFFFPDFIH